MCKLNSFTKTPRPKIPHSMSHVKSAKLYIAITKHILNYAIFF